MIIVTVAVVAAVAATILIKKYKEKKAADAELDAFLAALVEQSATVKKEAEAMELVASQSAASYMKEPPDLILEQKCIRVLKEMFPDGIEEKLKTISGDDEKKQFIRELVGRLRDWNAMDVGINAIIFKDMDPANVAYYSYNDSDYGKTITINSLYLDNLEGLIKVILHELKHAVQMESIAEGNKLNYSDQRVAQWAVCNMAYYEGQDSLHAYALQINEIDANIFASSVLDEFKK